jgi:hypothetical protein
MIEHLKEKLRKKILKDCSLINEAYSTENFQEIVNAIEVDLDKKFLYMLQQEKLNIDISTTIDKDKGYKYATIELPLDLPKEIILKMDESYMDDYSLYISNIYNMECTLFKEDETILHEVNVFVNVPLLIDDESSQTISIAEEAIIDKKNSEEFLP